MRESALSTKIIKAINAIPGAHAQKMHGSQYGHTGTPDIFACVLGRTVMLEVKMPGGIVSPAQLVELERWAEAGAVVAVVRSKAAALAAINVAINKLAHPSPSIN